MMTKGKDTGAWLEARFRDMLPEDCYQYKPADFRALFNLISRFPQIADKIPKAPCDRIGVYKGRSFFFELKHTDSPSIAYHRLKRHLIGSLLNHEAKGGRISYAIIGFKIGLKCCLYALRIGYYIALMESSAKKSLNIAELNQELEINKANIVQFLE